MPDRCASWTRALPVALLVACVAPVESSAVDELLAVDGVICDARGVEQMMWHDPTMIWPVLDPARHDERQLIVEDAARDVARATRDRVSVELSHDELRDILAFVRSPAGARIAEAQRTAVTVYAAQDAECYVDALGRLLTDPERVGAHAARRVQRWQVLGNSSTGLVAIAWTIAAVGVHPGDSAALARFLATGRRTPLATAAGRRARSDTARALPPAGRAARAWARRHRL